MASWGKHVLHIIRAFHSNASALYAAGWAAVPHVPRRLPRPPHVPRLPRVSPLRAADDAVVVDTTSMALDAVVERVLAVVRTAFPEVKG